MAARKTTVGSKSDFALRPSVPLGQKLPASEVNDIVAAINANYERLLLDWDIDVMDGQTVAAGQFVYNNGDVWQVTTGYNVGAPKTFDEEKATNITGGGTGGKFSFENSAETSKTVTIAKRRYFFTGSSPSDWDLPDATTHGGYELMFVNIGSNTLNLSGSLHAGGNIDDLLIYPGESYTLSCNGIRWVQTN